MGKRGKKETLGVFVDGELKTFEMPFLEECLLEMRHARDETTARRLAVALRRIVGNAPKADQPRKVLTFLDALMKGSAYRRSCFSQTMFGLFNDCGFEFDRAEEVNDFLWKILRLLPESMRKPTDALFQLVQRHIVVMLVLYHDHRFCFGEEKRPLKMRDEPMLETMSLWAQSDYRQPPCKYRRLLWHLARMGVPRATAAKLVGQAGERLDAILRSLEDGVINKPALHRLIASSRDPTPTGDLAQAILYAYPAIRLDDLWHTPRSPLFADTHAWPPPVPHLEIPEPQVATLEPAVAPSELMVVATPEPPEATETLLPTTPMASEPVALDTQPPTEDTSRLEAATVVDEAQVEDETPEEDLFADLLAVAELATASRDEALKLINEADPDLRELLVLSHDSDVMVTMALGDADQALEAHEEHGRRLRDLVERMRGHRAMQAPVSEIDEEHGRAAVASHLRRIVGRLSEASMGLAEISRALERQAVEVGTSYRRAFTERQELLDRLEGSWSGLNLAVHLHLATKPGATEAQREAFRSAARQALHDKMELEQMEGKRSQTEQAVHDMHRAWLEARHRVQEVRRKIGSARMACQLFDLDIEPFEATIAAVEETCRRALEEVDASKALVAIEPVNLPRVVTQTLDTLPHVESALEGLDRKGERELADLMLLAFSIIHSTRSHGRAPKTVAKMLTLVNLIEERDAQRAQDALRAHYLDSFERKRWKARVIWRITKDGCVLAERLLKAREEKEAITRAVIEGRRIVNEQWLERKRQAAERAKLKGASSP